MFDVRRYDDDIASFQTARLFPPFLIPPLARNAEKELPAAACGAMDVPIIAASWLKCHIGKKGATPAGVSGFK